MNGESRSPLRERGRQEESTRISPARELIPKVRIIQGCGALVLEAGFGSVLFLKAGFGDVLFLLAGSGSALFLKLDPDPYYF